MKMVTIGVASALSGALLFSPEPAVLGQVQATQSQSKLQAQAAYQCCYISANNIANHTTPSGALYALNVINSVPCQNGCVGATTALDLQVTADTLCNPTYNVPNGSLVRTYYKSPSGTYQLAATVGVLTNTPLIPSTQWKCPPTWLSNTSNQLGGITTDQRCKKQVATISGVPSPPIGTQLGSWGFTWGNEVWAYGTSANGGAAFHPSTPAQCHF